MFSLFLFLCNLAFEPKHLSRFDYVLPLHVFASPCPNSEAMHMACLSVQHSIFGSAGKNSVYYWSVFLSYFMLHTDVNTSAEKNQINQLDKPFNSIVK